MSFRNWCLDVAGSEKLRKRYAGLRRKIKTHKYRAKALPNIFHLHIYPGEHLTEIGDLNFDEPLDPSPLKRQLIYSRRRLTETESRLTDTESRLAETESRLAETESRLAEAESRSVETESRLTKSRLTKTESRLTETETRLAETESRLAETEFRLTETESRLTKQVDDLISKNTFLGRHCDALEREVFEGRRQISHLLFARSSAVSMY